MQTIRIIFLLIVLNTNAQISIDATEIQLNYHGDGNPKNLTKGINKLFFTADDGVNGEELWVYDKILNSTYFVKNIFLNNTNGFDNPKMVTVGDILYFTTFQFSSGTTLWKSDGTADGTIILKTFSGNFNNNINQLFAYNDLLIFNANDGINGNELWVSDGSEEGTILLKDINDGSLDSNPLGFTIFNGFVYFTAMNSINGREIWKTDGTSLGTELLKDINLTSDSSLSYSNEFLILDDYMYFIANDNNNILGLWRTDGSEEGTSFFKELSNLYTTNYSLIGASTTDFFVFLIQSNSHGVELWKCDGTISGTELLKDINQGIGSSVNENTQFVAFNNQIFFNASNSGDNFELWKTNGTSIGTQLVRDINVGNNGSNIIELTATNDFIIFAAITNYQLPRTLWKSEGDYSTTIQLSDVNLNQFSNNDLSFVEFNDLIFFPAGYNTKNGVELWTTDGNPSNTKLFYDIFQKFNGFGDFYDSAKLDDKLVFLGNDGNGFLPFITDGSLIGTKKIINSSNSTLSLSSSTYRPASFTKAGNYVYFLGRNNSNGFELWKTDGSEENTNMVKDIKIGNGNGISDETFFIEFNDNLFFKADDGISGEELWRTDGTSEGTFIVKDIYQGQNGSIQNQSNKYYNHIDYSNVYDYAISNGFLYFGANDGIDKSIWRTDGTQNGTIKIVTFPLNQQNLTKSSVVSATSNKIFFKTQSSGSGSQYKLWSSNIDGSNLLLLLEWEGNETLKKHVIFNDELYFTHFDAETTLTLMKSDGTIEGTTSVVGSFDPPINSDYYSDFNSLCECGGNIYFTIGQFDGAQELWRTNGTANNAVKVGNVTNIYETESYDDFNTCINGNLLFLKNSFSINEISYVNENSTDTNSYFYANVINGDNFNDSESYSISKLFKINDILLFSGSKPRVGNELFSSQIDFTLNTDEISEEYSDISKSKVSIYPNPAKDMVYFKTFDHLIINRISVYDLTGKEIINKKNINNELNLLQLKDGIYLLKIITDEFTLTHKLSIKK